MHPYFQELEVKPQKACALPEGELHTCLAAKNHRGNDTRVCLQLA